MNRPYIECKSLCKRYRSKNLLIDAVADINLQIEQGEFVLLKGRSGAGKSTLLNLIGGLIMPSSGTIRIGENIINEQNNNSLSRLLSDQIGIIFQSLNLLPTYNIYENIEIALEPKVLKKRDIEKLVLPYLHQFQLADKMHLFPSELSAGQQQKVAVIRTLVKQPSVILADEPTGSVDDETAGEILKCLIGLKSEKNVTIILATHGVVEDAIADRVILLENGRIKVS